jgi:predicted RNA-binding Zn-ribbon protein involved in translation (DUF1610 family)
MEYLGNCPNCGKHIIVQTIKRISHNAQRKPQREANCPNCGLRRITIIGEIAKVKKLVQVPKDLSPDADLITKEIEVVTFKKW